MLPLLVTVWMVASAVGGGAIIIRLLGLQNQFCITEKTIFSFVSGVGLMGWILFFPGYFGYFHNISFSIILAVLSLGIFLFDFKQIKLSPFSRLTTLDWIICSLFVLTIFFDVTEALSPPADADTMAYHFETPQQFVNTEKIFPIFRAFDGITQLLIHLTYACALGLGGEKTLNLWTMVVGSSLPAVFYVIAKNYMNQQFAAIGALLIMTTPAIIYASGTGQVESKTAIFVLASAYAFFKSTKIGLPKRQQIAWITFAGLNAGIFAATKITGLIFVFAISILVILGRGHIKSVIIFTIAVIFFGSQWYLFNWHHTGDPIFPLLWKYVTLNPNSYWDQELSDAAQRSLMSENPFPRSIIWFLSYPVRTIILPLPAFESLRTGVGPATLIGLPFFIANFFCWFKRGLTLTNTFLFIAVVFYSIWFFFGPSLRVRHLLPIYPLVLFVILLGCHQLQLKLLELKPVFVFGFLSVILIQFSGHFIFSKKFVSYVFSHETKSEFLEKNISGYNAVKWVNQNLTDSHRVLVANRDWLYYINVPYISAANTLQTDITLHDKDIDIKKFIHEINTAKISHVSVPEDIFGHRRNSVLGQLLSKIRDRGCLKLVQNIPGRKQRSRTFKSPSDKELMFKIFEYEKYLCRDKTDPINR